jgi:hypothetical protein
MTAPVQKKVKAEPVERDEFTINILSGKNSKYTHQFWNAVSKQK